MFDRNLCLTQKVFACHSHCYYSCCAAMHAYAMLSLSVASFSLHGRNAVMHENLGSRPQRNQDMDGTRMHAVSASPKMQRLPNTSSIRNLTNI